MESKEDLKKQAIIPSDLNEQIKLNKMDLSFKLWYESNKLFEKKRAKLLSKDRSRFNGLGSREAYLRSLKQF